MPDDDWFSEHFGFEGVLDDLEARAADALESTHLTGRRRWWAFSDWPEWVALGREDREREAVERLEKELTLPRFPRALAPGQLFRIDGPRS